MPKLAAVGAPKASVSLTKGQRTRAEIVRRSAGLMNRHGFLALPLSAVIESTGIQKGGLYRHFDSREALANEAFDYCVTAVRQRFEQALQGKNTACEQLLALIEAHVEAGVDVPLPGGCPIMNSAVETDHTSDPAHTSLRQRARDAMSGWHGLVQQIVRGGVASGELRTDVEPAQVASVFIACMEGAVLLTQLYGNAAHMAAARAHLASYIDFALRAQTKPARQPAQPTSSGESL
jgi:TetR/AcrR family transcriptional regulator, transcriptional repressor for nem operon